MPNVFDATGLTTATQDELLTNLTQNLQAIYGSDIDLSSNTPDGQWLNIIIQLILDVENLLTQINSSFDPDNAVGTQLDQRCAINGIQRQEGTYSETNITVVTTQSVNLNGLDQSEEQVFTVSDNIGNLWLLKESHIGVGPGTFVYEFRAENVGANITEQNTINIMTTIVLGVTQVNNPDPQSVVGLSEETDASLRIRRQISVAISSQGYLQGLLAALENIAGISSAFVYENDTNITDDNDVPGHSIWVIVDGTPTTVQVADWVSTTTYSYGDIVLHNAVNYISWRNDNLNNAVSDTFYWGVYNPVAQAIYTKRNAGCGMFGETEYNVTQIDGTQFTVVWDEVEAEALFIAFTATSIDGVNPPNIAAIKTYLVDNYTFTVNQEININQMATLVQQADSNCLITNAGLSLALVQIATLSGVAASGTFKFAYAAQQTSTINWNDSVGTIQTKLRLLTGLSDVVVSGSIASQTLTMTLTSNPGFSLIIVQDNTLLTAGSAPITFSFNEGYSNTLTTTTKKDKFSLAESNIIILPMQLSPSSARVARLATQQFNYLGGWGWSGSYVFSMQSNPTGGSVNSVSGLYTAGSSTGTDVLKVTDGFGNTATATIRVF